MKREHRVDGENRHHVTIDGLVVWVYPRDGQWVAHGIDVDYAASGRTLEAAQQAFVEGFSLTIVEHLRRFQSLERLFARSAPDEIRSAWIREVERSNMSEHRRPLTVSHGSTRNLPSVPAMVRFWQSPAHAA